MSTDQCINPSALEEGDLVAYLHGDASSQVVRHVAQCAFCAEQIEQLRMVDAQLLAAFYREACPAPEVLTDFVFNRLPATEKIRVAAHVRDCASCSKEVAGGHDLLQEEPPSLLARLREALAIALVARPVAQVAAFARGAGRKGRFETAGAVITITSRLGRLTGRVRWRKAVADADRSGEAWLLSPEMETVQQALRSGIDEQGYFQFTGLSSGSYALLLQIGDQNIAVETVEIERWTPEHY